MPDDDKRVPSTFRNFGQLLAGLEDGQLHSDLTEAYENMVSNMNSEMLAGHSTKATFTLKLDFKGKDGFIETMTSFAVKEPVKARRRSIAFVDPSGKAMSREDPRQPQLPIREVREEQTQVRQLKD